MYIYKQVNLKINKEIRNTLQDIKGIGWHKAILVCAKLGLAYPYACSKLNVYHYNILTKILDFVTILEEKVQRYVNERIQRYYILNTYRGSRHQCNLPVRGQRTRTNAKTKKKTRVKLSNKITWKQVYEKKKYEKKMKKLVKKQKSAING